MQDAEFLRYQKDCIEYLRHQKGIALFWLWLSRWNDMQGWSYNNELSAFELNQIPSARFFLGAPLPNMGASGQNAFIGIQREEVQWIKKIGVLKIVIDKTSNKNDEKKLWLIFNGRKSPDLGWPDIPPLALSMLLFSQALDCWNGNKIDLRGVNWQKDDDQKPKIHVSNVKIATIDVKHGSLIDNWSPNQTNVKTLRERAIEISNNQIRARGLEENPGFSGEAPRLNEAQAKLVEPFSGKIKRGIEEDYQNLFGQFLDGKNKRK